MSSLAGRFCVACVTVLNAGGALIVFVLVTLSMLFCVDITGHRAHTASDIMRWQFGAPCLASDDDDDDDGHRTQCICYRLRNEKPLCENATLVIDGAAIVRNARLVNCTVVVNAPPGGRGLHVVIIVDTCFQGAARPHLYLYSGVVTLGDVYFADDGSAGGDNFVMQRGESVRGWFGAYNANALMQLGSSAGRLGTTRFQRAVDDEFYHVVDVVYGQGEKDDDDSGGTASETRHKTVHDTPFRFVHSASAALPHLAPSGATYRNASRYTSGSIAERIALVVIVGVAAFLQFPVIACLLALCLVVALCQVLRGAVRWAATMLLLPPIAPPLPLLLQSREHVKSA